MVIIAFISTALLTFVIGFWIGVWFGRQVTLDEMKKEEK